MPTGQPESTSTRLSLPQHPWPSANLGRIDLHFSQSSPCAYYTSSHPAIPFLAGWIAASVDIVAARCSCHHPPSTRSILRKQPTPGRAGGITAMDQWSKAPRKTSWHAVGSGHHRRRMQPARKSPGSSAPGRYPVPCPRIRGAVRGDIILFPVVPKRCASRGQRYAAFVCAGRASAVAYTNNFGRRE